MTSLTTRESRPSRLAALTLFVSAYSPLAPILTLRECTIPVSTWPTSVIVALAVVWLLAVVSTAGLLHLVRSARSHLEVQVREISHRSSDVINYVVPYVVSFSSLKLGEWSEAVAFGILFVLIGVLTARTSGVFLNPTLAALGYRLYEIKYSKGRDGEVRGHIYVFTREALQVAQHVKLARVDRHHFLVAPPQ
jgi:hypothetical protein